MKTILLLVVLTALVVAGDVEKPKMPPPLPMGNTPGRFAIASGEYFDGNDTSKTILRIDTATGRTWQYIGVSFAPHQGVIGWVEVSENPIGEGQEFKRIFEKMKLEKAAIGK